MQRVRAARLFLFVVLIILDQTIKSLVIKNFSTIVSQNAGGAFGVGNGLDFYRIFTALIIVVFAIFYFKTKDIVKKRYLLIAISGAISNQIDRVFRDGVVDYIDLKVWPSFNMADICIFCGICLFAYSLISKKSST